MLIYHNITDSWQPRKDNSISFWVLFLYVMSFFAHFKILDAKETPFMHLEDEEEVSVEPCTLVQVFAE